MQFFGPNPRMLMGSSRMQTGTPHVHTGMCFLTSPYCQVNHVSESSHATHFCVCVRVQVDPSGGKNVCFYLRKHLLC